MKNNSNNDPDLERNRLLYGEAKSNHLKMVERIDYISKRTLLSYTILKSHYLYNILKYNKL